MKIEISTATLLLIGAGAAGAGAGTLGSAYQGADILFHVTNAAIVATGVVGTYVGAGSDTGQSAMAAGTQQMAPMSRMIDDESAACAFDGGGAGLSSASGIVIGLDAVDVLSSTRLVDGGAGGGGSAVGPGACNASGGGLAFNNTTIDGTVTFANYKQVLALVYGGKDVDGTVDCSGAHRHSVVDTWSSLYENHCTNTEAICNDTTHAGKLWHAFRPDDASGTADVFAALLGLSPVPSATSNNGFGASPYCNAMNWDASAANKTPACALGPAKQFTGPGGVPEGMCSLTNAIRCSAVGATSVCGNVVQALAGPGSVANGNGRVCDSIPCGATQGTCTPQCPSGESCVLLDGSHRKPPPGTWGEQPDPAQNTKTFSDVQPTSFQDNDPIRRPCIRNGHNTTTGGEDVCNMDGTLGVVLPVPASDFMLTSLHLRQYPDIISTDARTSFDKGIALAAFNCAPFISARHAAECPDGELVSLGNCWVPHTLASSQCYTIKADLPGNNRGYLGLSDGRIYNLHMRNGSITAGAIPYVNETIPVPSGGFLVCADGTSCAPVGSTCASDGSTCGHRLSMNFGGNFSRIHAASTVPTHLTACQLESASDQIGCLAQADHCSIGVAGDGADSWGDRNPNGPVASNVAPLLVNNVAPSATTVQALGNGAIEYPLARKLYFNSLVGFPSVNGDELTLAQFVAGGAPAVGTSTIQSILVAEGFFTLGAQSPAGANNPFCEDFNEQAICGAPSNANGCAGNPVGIPTLSTTCGDGVVAPYEECDPGTPPALWHCSIPGATVCSSTCRC